MTLEELVAWLEQADTPSVRQGLLELTDAERKTLAPKARGWLTTRNGTRVSNLHAGLAVLATARGARQAMVAPQHVFLEDDFPSEAVRLLVARAPSWLPDMVPALLDEDSVTCWEIARGLVAAGCAPVPDHPYYFIGTVFGINQHHWTLPERRSVPDALRPDPGLVGDHLVRLLATEGAGRALAHHDGFLDKTHSYGNSPEEPQPQLTWRVGIVELVASGELSRDDVLDAVLAAPLRDWVAADLTWYVGLHDALDPTLDEVAARQATYARVLTAEHGPFVKTAQKQLERLLGDVRLDPGPLLEASRATLSRTDKASVVSQLRLLDKLATQHLDLPCGEVVAIALEHPHADVRERARTLLVRLGHEPEPEAPVQVVAVPAAEARPDALPVQPVRDADELAEVLLTLLEEMDPLGLERSIDGLLRFGNETPSAAEVLSARAESLSVYSEDPRIAVMVLVRAWLSPRRRFADGTWRIVLGHTIFPSEEAHPSTVVGFLGRRLTGLAQALRGGRQVPVSLPVDEDGTVDAGVLSARLAPARRGNLPSELETAVALSRVPPTDRPGVTLPSSLRRKPGVAVVVEAAPRSWVRDVVTVQLNQWEPAQRVVTFRDAAGREPAAVAGLVARTDPGSTVHQELGYGLYDPRFESTLALAASVLPHAPDVLAAHAHPFLHRDLTKDRACAVPVLDALARSRTPNTAPVSSALVLGLGAKDARARTAAQDALLDLARFGVLDGGSLGREAATHLADDAVVGRRVSDGLTEVSRASGSAVGPVLDALVAMLHVVADRRDAGAFVGLTADLAERSGRRVDLPTALRDLAASTSSSAAAKAARRLL